MHRALKLRKPVRPADPSHVPATSGESRTSALQTEKLAAIGQLVSGIAHELNNPLTSIRGNAQLLLAEGGAKCAARAEQIFREAERAARIVQNLLFFARRARTERRPVDLNDVVERTLALRSYELRLENIEIELDLEPQLPLTLADADQMQQVALNLLINAEHAILHTAQAPAELRRVRIRTTSRPGSLKARPPRPRSGRIALEIADSGPGIPPEILHRLFEPFFSTKPAGLGTGLGLSIAYGIVQDHGGEIHAENATSLAKGARTLPSPFTGARFIVELPEHRVLESSAAGPERNKVRRRTSRSRKIAASLAGQRVLVVEDEAPVAELIRDVLQAAGCRVEMALDARAGLQRALAGRFDLILCDLRMPEFDGEAFFQALKDAAHPGLERMAFVTGDTLSRRSTAFLRRTGAACLSKPFLVEDLLHFVRRAITLAGEKSLSGEGKSKSEGAVALE